MITLSLPSPAQPLLPPSSKTLNPSRQNIIPSSLSLKNPNFEPLKNRLIRQLDVGRLHHAFSTLDLMTQQNAPPDLTTYSILLKSCIRFRNFQLGKLVHRKLMQSGLELDSVVLNTLISLYSKCGDTETARLIFEGMGNKRDLVSWSAMVSCFANNSMELQAIWTFLDMLELGFYPNEYCFAAVIRACSNANYAWVGEIIYGFVVKTGYLEADVCVGCELIDMFVKGSGDLGSAYKVFDKMPERNLVTWTLMITRFAQLGCARDAIDLFLDMELSGYVPDRFTYSSVLSACTELGLLALGKQLHSRVIRLGLALDVCVGCSLVDMYAKCAADGSVDDSRKVFERMPEHNVMSWTAIITAYVQSGECDKEAIELFCKMISGHIRPNHFSFSSVLKACGNLSDPYTGEQVYSYAVKLGIASVNCVGNSLISMYARSGRMEDAQKAFDILFEKNLVSYNAIVDGYAKNLKSEEAFLLFNEIADTGIGISAFTFASLLSGAASIGAMGKGEQIHGRLLKGGYKSNQCICNALISMYSRCGNIEAAFQVFNGMEDRNVISWTSMITGFAKHGFATRALEMFHKMLETGTKPNEITYVAVLSACSHVGMISEGQKHFNSMYKEHGIVPRMEHYACMVDLLGRSGLLVEAMEFINSMPLMADALVWRTLLGACRVHGNTELGRHAAEMILEQEPDDPAAYILLSNLHASAGQWKDVVKIRKSMKERNLIKEAGCSWIEVENRVHRFHVGETSHPQAWQIYQELDQLASKIKEMGYIPDTDFVLHDIEEEQKEQFLFQHSEKIAVAFGLISTIQSKPIRIFKNLRVCGDCHTAIKYISMATGREIVVRDSNRFHHIKNGVCSCNDYW
ncbi:pentatricopeptide repeat-containing protein At3g49170, chloroplastic-like [Vitis riparia]|uniref:pentatricopeptide repeat-containing protein At3g49170, chloroplastic-like n=1 Tax=Vitis riparia TaxID=96939 RepID=UPI00155AC17A|nr:pentatricopeptide repeat-containing protein At3g49170, chloroplastic-like [Vitis riparia]